MTLNILFSKDAFNSSKVARFYIKYFCKLSVYESIAGLNVNRAHFLYFSMRSEMTKIALINSFNTVSINMKGGWKMASFSVSPLLL